MSLVVGRRGLGCVAPAAIAFALLTSEVVRACRCPDAMVAAGPEPSCAGAPRIVGLHPAGGKASCCFLHPEAGTGAPHLCGR